MFLFVFTVITALKTCENKQTAICDRHCYSPMSINCTYMIDAEQIGRCCVTKSEEVLGLDLSSCSLSSIDNLFSGLNNLQVLYLQNNSIQVPEIEAFHGLTKLNLLKLPPYISCPGGVELWNKTEQTTNSMICINEFSTCTVYNVSCPNQNSYCVDVGPQVTECLCKPGFHGYKCLRKGTFPVIPFVIGLGVSTIVISGLLWVTQRRKAKKQA